MSLTDSSILWSDLVKRIVSNVLRFSGSLNCTPMAWDPLAETFVIAGGWRRYVGWYFNVAVCLTYESFLIFRLVQLEIGAIQMTHAEAAVVKFWVGIYLFNVVCHLAMIAQWRNLPGMVSRSTRWFRRIERYYHLHQNPEVQSHLKPALENFFFSSLCSDLPWLVLWVIPAALYPHQYVYPTSLAGDHENMGFLWRVGGVAIYAYIIVTWYSTMYVWFSAFLPTTMNLPVVLETLLAQLEQAGRASSASLSAYTPDDSREVLLRFYREAQILSAEFHDVCCTFLIPGMKWTVMLAITYCMYGSLALPDWPSRALLLAIFIVVLPFMEIIFAYLGQFWTQSNAFLRLGKRHWTDQEGRRVLKSMTPIKAVMGSLYFIDELSAIIGIVVSDGQMNVSGDINVDFRRTTYRRCSSDCVDYQPYRPLELIKIDTSVIPTPFASRENELQSIKDALALDIGCGARIAILVGMGGAGKSTLARVYAKNEHKVNPYTNMIWIDAENEESIKTALQPVLKACTHRHTENADRTDDISAIYGILKNRTLLVFNNVDDPKMIRSYLPKMVNAEVEILITSRKADDWVHLSDNVIKIGVLERRACEVYIRTKLAKLPVEVPDVDKYWEDLASHFGYLAIALESATSAIVAEARLRRTSSRPFTIAEFLQIIQSADMLDVKDDEYDPVETTYKPLRQLWIVTFKKLADLKFGGLGLRILNSLAFCSPNGVPSEWFPIMFKDQNTRDVPLALELLDSWSLAEVTESKQCLIHRVLRETLLSRLWADDSHRREFYKWFLSAVQNLYSRLRRERKLQEFYASLNVILRNLEKEEKYISLIVPFIAYMEHRGDVRCNLYLENLQRMTSRIADDRNDDDFDVLDQLIQAKFKIGSLLTIYAEQAKKRQSSVVTLEKVCKALKNIAQLHVLGNACAKIPETVVEVFESAIFELGPSELLTKINLSDLVNLVIILLQVISKNIEVSPNAHAQNHLQQMITTTDAICDILAELLRFSDMLQQPAQTQFAVLKAIMWWNWVAKCLTDRQGDSIQDPFAARGLFTLQRLLRCSFEMQASNVSSFCTVLSMSENCCQDIEAEINIEGHSLTAINEIIGRCRTSQCKNAQCKVLELLIDFVDTSRNFAKCMLPVMAIYIGIDAHVTMFENEKDHRANILLKIMKNKLERTFGLKDDAHYHLALVWRISNIGSVSRNFTFPNPQEEQRSSTASIVLEFLLDESNEQSVRTIDTFYSNVAEKGYNNETTFSRFQDVLESDFGTDGCQQSFCQTTVQAAMKEFHEADLSEHRFNCKCIHTNYQLWFAQHCFRCDRLTEAFNFAEKALKHRLYCYKSNEIEIAVDLMIEVWYATETVEQNENRVRDLLLQVVRAQDEYFTSSFYKREACNSVGRFIQFLCQTGAVEEAIVVSQKLVASLRGHLVLPTSCLIVLHTLLLRDNSEQLVQLVKKWEPVFSQDLNSFVILKVLECIARRDVTDCESIELEWPFEGVFAFRPLVDTCWSLHVLTWMRSNSKNLHKSERLLKDRDWINWIQRSFQDETIKLCCGKSDKAIDDVIIYYQTLEILLFGKRKKMFKAVEEAEKKMKDPDGCGLNYKFSDALTRGAIRTIVHEYRRKNLWFQRSGGSGRTRFLQRDARGSNNPPLENEQCHIV